MLYPRSLSVQSKLIVAFVLLTLASIAVVSWVGYVTARQSLRAASERQLMSLQRSKSALVQNILKSARNEVLSLSASQVATDAARELSAAYRQLAQEPVTPEMQAEVRRFYRDEFEPALAEKTAIKPPEGSLLPTTQTGWYLHYHYLATGKKPYSVDECKPLGHRQERVWAGCRPEVCRNRGADQSVRAGKSHAGRPRDV